MAKKDRVTGRKRYQVFLSYASADKIVAREIVDYFNKHGVSVWFDQFELAPGESIKPSIDSAISASDYLVILLSPNSVISKWIQEELNATLMRELTTRDITLLPVIISDCEIPSLLKSCHYLDLRTNFEQGMNQLVEQIGFVPSIDFSRLNVKSFMQLVIDLLLALGFSGIEKTWKTSDEYGDIKASYFRIDPFGVEVKETWLIEIKFYRKSRADLLSIYQLASYLSNLPEHFKGLIVTNGQITSATRHWLESAQTRDRIEVRVLDGTELKRLLLKNENLVHKYFI